LDNAGIRNVAADFTQPIRGFAEAERLEGTYFSWDSEHPGHFGHILTEQVSRLWAWEIAKAAYPDIRMLVSRYSWRAEVQPAEAAVLRAIGVDPSDVVRITATTRVQRLVGATGMFCQPYYVSPRIADTWHRLAPGIVADATVQRLPKRIFVSRRGGTRDCTNVDEVEELFRSHGFQIVFPAELSFADQVAVFRGAEIVAGFAGSNMFHLMFTGPVRVLLLTSENYLPRNEELIAAVLGHELDIFWGVPVDRTNGSSPFTVDFAREGRLLREVLGSLDK
jgi:capsular polysaccharide biosynthesis protein